VEELEQGIRSDPFEKGITTGMLEELGCSPIDYFFVNEIIRFICWITNLKGN
jgi:hypothetical protein